MPLKRTEHCLARRDLIELEPVLGVQMSRFVTFTSHSVYFPREKQDEALWLADEARLLVPLFLGEDFLGMFVAREVSALEPALVPFLPEIARLCLEKLEFSKMSSTDALTGFATSTILLGFMEREIEQVRACFSHAPREDEEEKTLLWACMGLIAVHAEGVRALAQEHGFSFADTCLRQLAAEFLKHLPEQSIVARTDDYEFSVLVPSGSRVICQKMAEKLVAALDSVVFTHPLTHKKILNRSSAGYAVYPQDMDGSTTARDVAEYARFLLNKARLAAMTARACEVAENPSVLGFHRIVPEGGLVLEILPQSQLLISLGRRVNAREGQQFSVWGSTRPEASTVAAENALNGAQWKGDIVLTTVHDDLSVAEVLYQADAARPFLPSDHLRFLAEESIHASSNERSVFVDAETGLLQYGDFQNRVIAEREECTEMCLVLIQVGLPDAENSGGEAVHTLVQVVESCRAAFGLDVCGARYGLYHVAFFHPHRNAATCAPLYTQIVAQMKKSSIHLAIGLAGYPFLQFHKAECFECARKALDYALLLPEPQVGIFGSLALNISADKRYSLGDIFGAIEEYKTALLADNDNALAWNALGVCMAGLGRHAEALRHLEEALQRNPQDAAALYNIGTVYQSLHDHSKAIDSFSKCLEHNKKHLHAHIRLGQLFELEGKMGKAKQHYQKATKLDKRNSLAHRCLANLARSCQNTEAVREHLHDALQCNPHDALAMSMLAGVYLDGGEDPEVAEMLARQSVALRPEWKPAWFELGRALKALGQDDAANEAFHKAQGA